MAAALLVAAGILTGFAISTAQITFGRRFPAVQLATGTASVAGCVTSDKPAAMIELDALGRNLRRQCPLTANLGGYSYDLKRADGRTVPRRQNTARQQHAVAFLASGDATVITEFRAGFGLQHSYRATVRSWPVTVRSGRFTVRAPLSGTTPGTAGPGTTSRPPGRAALTLRTVAGFRKSGSGETQVLPGKLIPGRRLATHVSQCNRLSREGKILPLRRTYCDSS